ncbi:MAG: A/G-specific adenine glycosylase [Rhodocyclaceae bacterium]|nr:A/G-specific adenine glycosylase [Rhodocyclaceae bacterium]
MPSFAQRLIAWQRRHGRHDLPWQGTREPYRVWLAEIMLQQTQVATVLRYYERFLERFPTLEALAAAPLEEVMAAWSGLGYYARARHLHQCAQLLISERGGAFPSEPAAIARLPGIGRSTANAIAACCFGRRVPILDGNVKRVLCRHLGIPGWPGEPAIEARLWHEAEALLPEQEVPAYLQAQMDLGALVCTRLKPRCGACPVRDDCLARRQGLVTELPTPRPKKPLPEREATFLVLKHGERVLFELRPPAGIWGGLLSLPELPAGREAVDYAAQRFGLTVKAVFPAPSFTHVFTHFRLRLAPLVCAVGPSASVAEPALRWLTAEQWAQAALPAPIRKMLSAIP